MEIEPKKNEPEKFEIKPILIIALWLVRHIILKFLIITLADFFLHFLFYLDKKCFIGG